MDSILHGGVRWHIVQAPVLEFCHIDKEIGTHGKVYIVWDKSRTLAFISQSIPVITETIFQKTKFVVNNSSIYRMVRLRAKKDIKDHWRAKKYDRKNLDEFNKGLNLFISLIFITKNVDLYAFKAPEQVVCQSSERTCPLDHERGD
jgi:hypothetical protein